MDKDNFGFAINRHLITCFGSNLAQALKIFWIETQESSVMHETEAGNGTTSARHLEKITQRQYGICIRHNIHENNPLSPKISIPFPEMVGLWIICFKGTTFGRRQREEAIVAIHRTTKEAINGIGFNVDAIKMPSFQQFLRTKGPF
jgi:hypothetical protein